MRVMVNQTEHLSEQKRILVIDDESGIRELLQEILSLEGYDTISASNGPQAIGLFRNQSFDLVIVDLLMPGMSGSEVAKALFEENPEVPIILITGSDSDTIESETANIPIASILTKPFVMDDVLGLVSHLIASSQN